VASAPRAAWIGIEFSFRRFRPGRGPRTLLIDQATPPVVWLGQLYDKLVNDWSI